MTGFKNFQVNRNKSTRGMNIFDTGRNHRTVQSKSEKMMSGIAIWASWYRFRMDIFARDYLGIQLKLFQVLLIFAMQTNNYFMYLASRGQGKSFLSAVYAVCRCILYPGTIVVIASGTKGQATSVLKKIEQIMINSPNLRREILDLKLGVNSPGCLFHNGSSIMVVTSNDNARSARAHVILIDEFRQVDLPIITKVLRKFLTTPRQAGYHAYPEYEHLQERNKEIYLSSCYYKSHWSWDRAQTYFKSMIEGKKYFICSLPYQLAIKERLLMKEQVLDEMSEADFDAIGWEMEMQALWFGENEKSYFSFEDLNKNRRVAKAFYPSEIADYINDKKPYAKKETGEIRIISADIATKGGSANDATAIFCVRLIPTVDGYERHVVYSETFDGGIVSEQSLRINQLFNEFAADYLVLDTLNAGIFLLDVLGQGQIDPRNGQEYPPLKCMNDDELAKRCVYPNAQKAIYSIQGTSKLNSKIAVTMKNSLRNKKLKLMLHENDAEEILETLKGYKSLPEDIKIKFKMPFIQTSLLINETINLEATYNDQGEVSLKEIGSARKDRYSSLSYLNYFVSHYLEPKNRKTKQEFKPAQLFMYKKPKLY
ncbi:terminase family protein [Solibacillus sp. FSL H8-0523]|uniref:terminase large subunit domain-containing protein n=1 Tax=Solibacillus sp. FSL H8-0523 TaxID=2954511 RepID=UPI0031016F08